MAIKLWFIVVSMTAQCMKTHEVNKAAQVKRAELAQAECVERQKNPIKKLRLINSKGEAGPEVELSQLGLVMNEPKDCSPAQFITDITPSIQMKVTSPSQSFLWSKNEEGFVSGVFSEQAPKYEIAGDKDCYQVQIAELPKGLQPKWLNK